ncbi:autotransporter outer membrane beta-barrel domain-containing protein [uncultured Phascolarctobacterium sp.]|uniref:autotransporter outer membrane beta-barrel domain-containing protein n=1 Tax=uncultured Phascolarctobacterium sp. TaxID=512296 RepID=UPI0025F5F56B|nr:autotransporter outer membrane beta-barrel domain-containing protein [uncultured Phascolarctobacterium sp.]
MAGGILTDGSAYGGKTNRGDALYNSLLIEASGTVNKNVYGGFSASGNADFNTITINSGTVKENVYGGFSASGAANYNTVTITASTVGIDVSGGSSLSFFGPSGEASYNTVTISSNSQIGGGVNGGSSFSFSGPSGDASYNTVTISSNSQINGAVSGGSSSSGNTDFNNVAVTDAEVEKAVNGGASLNGSANNNRVTITGGTVGGSVFGGNSNSGQTNHNTVVISNSHIKSAIYGGFSTSNGAANNNSITITGGTIDGSVYGGYAQDTGDANNNTVTIIGDVSFANTSLLSGSQSGSGKTNGNTLNIASAGLSLGNVANFASYNFYLTDANIYAGPVLTLLDVEKTNLKNAKINATLSGATNALRAGDTVTLLNNDNGFFTNSGTTANTTLQQGFSLIYGIEFENDNQNIGLKVTGYKQATEQSKSPTETRLATVGFLNSGADNFTDKGIANAVAVASSDTGAVFAAAGGGQSRLHSGSYTDIKGYNFALGAAKAITNNAGKLTYGPFAEAGWGNYDSHLDCGVRGDGNTHYYGIGAFARQDNNNGTYYEGSLRYGQTTSDYRGSGLTDGLGNPLTATYDSSAAYYGAHVGIGKVSKLTDSTSADVYAKLLYTHQQGNSVVMAGSGETYDFGSVNSTRARVGARLSKACNDRATAYVGTAYEYEFDGEATATVKGFSTLAPSIKGGSGMLELGYSLKPKAANDPTIDLSLQGWLGKKEGFTTNVNFMWKF